MNLEDYGEVLTKMNWEGDSYYIKYYAYPEQFDSDPELQAVFIRAQNGLIDFHELLNKRITQLGGNPEDYDV